MDFPKMSERSSGSFTARNEMAALEIGFKAVLAYDDGYTYTEISRILLIDDETVRRHIQDYCNENKLSIESGGSDSKLNEKQTQALIAHLSDHTYLTADAICLYVKEKYQIKYTVSGMMKWLHANEFSYKKPHGVPAKANAEAQAAFIAYYEKLKKHIGSEPLYFTDSVHPQHQTRLAYGWIPKGERKEMPTTGRQKRVNIIGWHLFKWL
jgi:transposase